MNDTDITPAPRPPADDSTEQLSGQVASSRETNSESTLKSIAVNPAASDITLNDRTTDDTTEKSLPPAPRGSHATTPPGDRDATDLIDKPADTAYAALLPEQETFIPDAGVTPAAPA